MLRSHRQYKFAKSSEQRQIRKALKEVGVPLEHFLKRTGIESLAHVQPDAVAWLIHQIKRGDFN